MDPKRLGPYAIESRLGRGGMGVVYLATDTRLGRSVAVKTLPAESDAAALGRFLREAKTVAALQHPHIATLLDVGEEQGASYLVMEKLDGESLQAALERGPLPAKDVAKIGEQIAGALAHAHGLGVLHRDIKPSNIMLTPGRGAVLLDFGVAQRIAREEPAAEPGNTESMDRLTRAGGMVGTLSYLSPEHIQGLKLDGRSDLFQLGVTLYEAAAGVHPFGGPTNVDVMHAILRTPPRPLSELGQLPGELTRIIAKLLEKDPEYRYPDARALLVDLRGLERSSSSWSSPTVETTATRRERRSRWTPPRALLAALAGLVVGAAAVGLWPRGSSAVPARILPFSHGEGNDAYPSFSPDGKSLVFASDRGGNWNLWVGLVAGGPPIRITDTPEAESQPAWSPDGSRVAFQRKRASENAADVYVMPALGGPSRRLAEKAADACWSPDGQWLAYADLTSGWASLAKVRADGSGAPVAITPVEAGFFHRHPSWSDDGRTVVFNRSPGGLAGEILAVSADGGAARPVTRDALGTTNLGQTVASDGYVVHASDRGGTLNLWRVAIDGGTPQRITSGPGSDTSPSVSRDGRRIAYVTTPVAYRLAWSTAAAPLEDVLVLSGSEVWAPDVAPRGSALTFAMKTPGSPWRMALFDKGALRIVLESVPDVVWSRFDERGETLVFDASFPSGSRVGRVKLDGTGLVWLTPPEEHASYPHLSPDGRTLAFVRTRGQDAEIVVRTLDAQQERVLVKGAALPRFSPDGSRLAFARSRSFAGGIGVVDVAGGEPRWLTTSGTWPTWLPDGNQVAYADLAPDGSQAARVVPAAGGEPRAFGSYRWRSMHSPFAVSPDGKRLLLTDDAATRSSIWIAEYP